jgi:adenine-specific DNA-methyltransferase
MAKKTKLELTWPGKDERPQLEPRILIEHPQMSYASPDGEGIRDNILIKGDNLLALKALEQEYAGKVKCIFIDPPYNTGSAFQHYEDGLEHSLWLRLLRDRINLLHDLLSEDGSLWITIDDAECHYLKVITDEVFGRGNFVANCVWQKKSSPQANAIWLSDSHDHVLAYAKSKNLWRPNKLPRSDAALARYKNKDSDPRGAWTSGDCTISLTGGQRGAQFARTGFSANIYSLRTPSGREVSPPPGTCWRFSQERFAELIADGRVWFGEGGNNVPRLKRFLSEVQEGVVPVTWWPRDEVGDNQEAKREVIAFNSASVFATPKPERLMQRIIEIATVPGDLVLDSFAGSGTTGAVAQKMGRRWIMVEIGDHADTHIVPRLRKVASGEDQGGISKEVDWHGGGAFRYYTLGPSLLERDAYGNWIISKEYDGERLAQAMCKQLGFTYAPSDDPAEWWRHGQSTERDFLYVTTQSLTRDALKLLSDEVGPDRTLQVCARAFSGDIDGLENLTCCKIPTAILTKCEWGRDDYSLNVSDAAPIEAEVAEETAHG